tara:strand:- start:114 stop:452 length:339 start_codon:yes stop_codon:yes gene_type:complete
MLTYDTVVKIGNLVGLMYVDFNGRSDIPDDPSDGIIFISGKAYFRKAFLNMPPLLVFTVPSFSGLHSSFGHNDTDSIYVINLKTLKPTKNSYRQIELPSKIKNLITSELNSL